MSEQQMGSRDPRLWLILVVSNACYALGPSGFREFMKGGLAPEIAVGFLLCIGSVFMIPFWIRVEGVHGAVHNLTRLKFWMTFFVIVESILSMLYFLLFIYAMNEGTIVQVSLLSRVSPVLILFLAVVFLREKIGSILHAIGALVLCLLGVLVASNNAGALLSLEFNLLLFLGLGVALSDAVRNIFMPKVQNAAIVSDAGLVCITMMIAGGLALLYAYLLDPTARYPNSGEYFGLLLLGFLTVAFPKWLRLKAYSSSAKQILVSASSYLAPIFGGAIAYVWHGETMDPVRFMIAFGLIVVGLYVLTKAYKNN